MEMGDLDDLGMRLVPPGVRRDELKAVVNRDDAVADVHHHVRADEGMRDAVADGVDVHHGIQGDAAAQSALAHGQGPGRQRA
jgi:hypothetical protein